jgi:hypothetical protein
MGGEMREIGKGQAEMKDGKTAKREKRLQKEAKLLKNKKCCLK